MFYVFISNNDCQLSHNSMFHILVRNNDCYLSLNPIFYLPVNNNEGKSIFMLFIIFIFSKCIVKQQSKVCRKDPCLNIASAVVGTCEPDGDTDFTCQCQSGHQWDDETNSCLVCK